VTSQFSELRIGVVLVTDIIMLFAESAELIESQISVRCPVQIGNVSEQRETVAGSGILYMSPKAV